MNIERLDISAFGRLEDFDTGEAPLSSLVVVLGPNEAGKSTVFEFLTTLLYGFLPASRELNPLVPWGSDEARGSLRLRLHDGRVAEVTRRLRSQPAGRLLIAEKTTDLRNHPLPWVEHVPRRVFRQVFAVTLGELASLDEDTWVRIQDRVIGSMGAADLRPVREVVAELEREAGELWRPNRRGNQRVREARDRLRALRARRREAVDRDRELRGKVVELERTQRILQAKRDRRAKEEGEVERARLLAPVRAQLLRIEALREEGGPEERLQGLPAQPSERLAELEALEARLQGRLDSLEAEREGPSDALVERTPHACTLLGHRDEITRYAASMARVAADRDRISELRSGLHASDESLDRMSRELIGRPWAEAPQAALLGLAPGSMKDAVERVERARRTAAPVRADGAVPGAAHSSGSRIAAVLLLILGVALVAWGVRSDALGWSALGAALAAASAAWAWTDTLARRDRTARRARLDDEHAGLEAERRQADERFRALIHGIPLVERHVEEPGTALVSALERLHDLADARRGKARAYEDAAARLDSAKRDGQALARRLSVPFDLGDEPEGLEAVLSSRLRRAERAVQAAESATRELDRLDRAAAEIEAELSEVRARLEALRDAAGRFGAETLEEGLQHAARGIEAHERAKKLREELERSHPDLEVLSTRIAEAERVGASWIKDEGDLARRAARIQQLTDEIEDLAGKSKRLGAEIEHAGGGETADRVDGEIATLTTETEDLVRERDRKWLLSRLLKEADRRFREEHQPDLMRRASAYLAHLTGGRYDRIIADESEDSELFRIAGPSLAGPIPLRHPISTGTLEQAYLSLRLAIVDHLDHGTEPLPLFIDEIFVNWDAERRSRGLEVVRQIAETRQVFVFTCHPPLALELESAGAQLIRLERR